MGIPDVAVGIPAFGSLALLVLRALHAIAVHPGFFRHLAASAFATFNSMHRDKKLLPVVRQRLLLQKVGRVRLLYCLFAAVMVPWSMATLQDSMWPFTNRQPQAQHRLFAGLQHFWLAVVVLRPGFVRPWNVDLHCGALVLLGTAELLPWISSAAHLRVACWKCVVIWAAVCGARRTSGMPLFYLTGLANVFVSWAAVKLHGKASDTQTLGWRTYLLLHLLVLAAAHIAERAAEAEMATKLKGEDTEQLLAAAEALLRGCCDVVVELNGQGAVMGRAEDLGSYLLRGSALRGMLLTELLVHEEERTQMQERLFAPPQEGKSVAESMPVSLRDGSNNILRVEMLWFSFFRLGQELAFMVGFREFAEAAPPPPLAQEPISGWVLTSESEEISETSSHASSEASMELPAPLAVVDSTLPGMPVKELSASFCMRIGRLPIDASFTQHLKKPDAWGSWLQASVNVINGEGEEKPRPKRITFQLPQGRVEAVCALDQGQECVDLENVRLRFCMVRVQGERRERRSTQLLGTPRRQQHTVSI